MISARIHAARLLPDPERVIGQLFLPGEESSHTHSRAAEITARVMALPDEEITRIATDLLRDFGGRHPDVRGLFLANAAAVASRVAAPSEMTEDRALVLGASFTAEFAVEGGALCNPSAVVHPDQTGLAPGRVRVALALRAIGEGHLSSIGFAEAIIGPGRQWVFEERAKPLWRADVREGEWSASNLRALVAHEGIVTEITHAVLGVLPEVFTPAQLDAAIVTLPHALSARPDSHRQIEVLRELAASGYRAVFPVESVLSQRVLTPVAAEEHHGMEDARFVQFSGAGGATEYRATYTAYDGREVAPRLIITPDLREFSIHRLTGDGAHHKGMALFPRLIDGVHVALCRTDGENISLARSADGLVWSRAEEVHTPFESWEVVKSGNCGSPIETDEGWLVLTHGVGPMRRYVLGAMLLDRDDPSVVRGRTTVPILEPREDLRDGYVPNVVYSCGALLHAGVLWIPVGIGDSRIGVVSMEVADLLAELTRGPIPGPGPVS